jgi:hypothetical protein
MLARAASAQATATHVMIDIAALDLTTTQASGGRDVWVGSSSAEAEGRPHAETRVDRGDVQVNPCVPALETGQACAMRWGVASVEAAER